MKKFFESKMGEFLKADEMTFNPGSGYVGLKKAEFKTEAFDQLHFPFALKGGFIDEMSFSVPVSVFSNSPAKVKIKNVFFVFGPHITDWTWEDVHRCKTKLIDLIMKIYELKPAKKIKSNKVPEGGWMADMKKKFIEDTVKKFVGMLEVEISNIHIRYEDLQQTQAQPFAAGFKMGVVMVSSKANPRELRTTGDWKHSPESHADPFFCQNIVVRRISSYWDIGEGSTLFGPGMVDGKQVFQKFKKLNFKEIWRLAVVENILKLFPPDHPRRKYLEGPRFRERLDYHQYILFPASLNTHVTVNRPSDAMRLQKAPLKDADVILDPVEVALDSEQIRSLNELMAYQKTFKRKDDLFRTRPREPIEKYLKAMAASRERSSSSSSPSLEELKRRHGMVVRSWWHHAFQGVRIMCAIPKSHLDQDELKQKAKLREEYINLCLQEMQAAEQEKEEGTTPGTGTLSRGTLQGRLKDTQMLLPLADVLNWRMLARERRQEKLQHAFEEQAGEEEHAVSADQAQLEKVQAAMPSTLQVRVHVSAFQAFFLIVADSKWAATLGAQSQKIMTMMKPTRQAAVKAQALDLRMEAVQRGRAKHRIARWAEVGIGSISVTNCNARRSTPATRSARQILSIMPFEHRQGVPLCVYIGFTTLEIFERNFEPGDMPISAVLEPSEGVTAHLQDFNKDRPELVEKLGFLKDFKDEIGRFMIFSFVRVGQVRALDYQPFRRRLEYFLKRGRGDGSTDLVRRPSPLALDRELLVKLQRKVEKITGKSNMLGLIEAVTDGVRGRLVDHYNSQHVLCKEVSVAPMRCKALRNGCPQTFHCQFHQMLPKEDQRSGVQPMGENLGLLPWKAAMLLLPKADFAMGLELDEKHQEEARVKTLVPDVKVAREKTVCDTTDPATIVLAGTTFLKWGRNGKAKKRFIIFNESDNAIIWKDNESSKNIVGAIPLSKIQDVCEGAKTPVLLQVRSTKLRQDKVWSIIATDRTLDLQAESSSQRDRWVSGLKARYKKFLQKQTTDPEALWPLPKSLEKRVKSYPEKYRSNLCELRATCKRLQSITALTKSVEATSNMTKKVQLADPGSAESKDEAV